MLKIRVIPTLLYKEFGLVKGKQFNSDRAVGSPVQAISVYEKRSVDELVFLDVGATLRGDPPDFGLIDELADSCFMPLTVGGGIGNPDDVARLLEVGADKVCIGSAAVDDPRLVELSANRFGSQCVVVSIDWRGTGSEAVVWSRSGTEPTAYDPVKLARVVESCGAGEIIATSIDHDGMMDGYDLATLAQLTGSISLPVVASGGAGTYDHLVAAVKEGGATAIAASSMFLFTEQTPREAKRLMSLAGIPVRRDSES